MYIEKKGKQQRNFLKFIKEDEHFRQYYDGMFILFETGLRISELCGLTIKDIQHYLNLGSVQSVYHWLNGISLPTVDKLNELRQLPASSHQGFL